MLMYGHPQLVLEMRRIPASTPTHIKPLGCLFPGPFPG
jgi:hypothetical protein